MSLCLADYEDELETLNPDEESETIEKYKLIIEIGRAKIDELNRLGSFIDNL